MTNGPDSIEPISSTDLFARTQRGDQRAVTNMCSMARMPSCAAAS